MAISIQSRSFESLYDDLIALPENITSEIYNGALHADPRPSDRMLLPIQIWACKLECHTILAMEGRVAGGFSMSLNCTWENLFWVLETLREYWSQVGDEWVVQR